MPASVVAPLTPAQLDEAAALLDAQTARVAAVHPALAPGRAGRADAREALAGLLDADGAHGVGVVHDGRLVAYLVGCPRIDPQWGRACWSPPAGHAVDPAAGGHALGDAYADWSRHWVARGIFRHYVHAPATEPWLLDGWADLNFARMQAHALRPADGLDEPPAATFAVRPIEREDLAGVEPLVRLIPTAHLDTPTYAVTLPEQFARYDAASFLPDGPGPPVLVAVEDDRVLGVAAFEEAEPDVMIPDDAWELVVAMTAPEARGRGVQRALLAAGLAAARAAGVRWCATDWRTANPTSSRAWPRLGFRATHYRLHRHVDERVAWPALQALIGG